MGSAVQAGMRYFAIVFAAAFVLGVLRTLVVAPRVGDLAAVCMEVPLVLGLSWLVSRRLVRDLPTGHRPRLVMGAVAFVLLMATEIAMATLFLGQSLADYAAALITTAGLVGLAGQVGFGLMPVASRP